MILSQNEIRSILYLINRYSIDHPTVGYEDLRQKLIKQLQILDSLRS